MIDDRMETCWRYERTCGQYEGDMLCVHCCMHFPFSISHPALTYFLRTQRYALVHIALEHPMYRPVTSPHPTPLGTRLASGAV